MASEDEDMQDSQATQSTIPDSPFDQTAPGADDDEDDNSESDDEPRSPRTYSRFSSFQSGATANDEEENIPFHVERVCNHIDKLTPPQYIRFSLPGHEYGLLLESKGLEAVASKILDDEISSGYFKPDPQLLSSLKSLTLSFLTGIHRPTLKALIEGDLAYQVFHNHEVNKRAMELRDQVPKQLAGIYQIALVDKCGMSPTAAHLIEAHDVALHYTERSDDQEPERYEHFEEIDTYKHAAFPRRDLRWRRYLMHKVQGRWKWKTKRVDAFRLFLHNLKYLLDTVPNSHLAQPFPYPLRDIGYSSDLVRRAKDHAEHQSSNALMCLLDAVIATTVNNHVSGSFDGSPYKQMFVVVSFIPATIMSPLAEIALTRLASAYSEFSGVGLNTHPAGRSVPLPNDPPPTDAMFQHSWMWGFQNSAIMKENMADDQMKAKAKIDKLQKKFATLTQQVKDQEIDLLQFHYNKEHEEAFKLMKQSAGPSLRPLYTMSRTLFMEAFPEDYNRYYHEEVEPGFSSPPRLTRARARSLGSSSPTSSFEIIGPVRGAQTGLTQLNSQDDSEAPAQAALQALPQALPQQQPSLVVHPVDQVASSSTASPSAGTAGTSYRSRGIIPTRPTGWFRGRGAGRPSGSRASSR
ncbi:hypothetical protein BT63DRAFT_172794 [Microthyrium microscopicum]|uniref:Uncharacterized protein n=1 Tax=Microthyrium microscopicum TaxID=703497 RepID=A0A6A6UP23_9PEZI|nr:hypothetical protein BT63DRAFT_172794 [Microthyrium microscopicum]